MLMGFCGKIKAKKYSSDFLLIIVQTEGKEAQFNSGEYNCYK
jgi:hypothetical protein